MRFVLGENWAGILGVITQVGWNYALSRSATARLNMYSIAPLKSEEVFVDEGTTEHCSTSNRAHQIERIKSKQG